MQWSSKRWAVILGVVGIVAVGTQFFGKTTDVQGTDNPVVGIVQIAQHPSLDEANRGFVAALQEAYPNGERNGDDSDRRDSRFRL